MPEMVYNIHEPESGIKIFGGSKKMKWEFVKVPEWSKEDVERVRFCFDRFNLLFDVKKTESGFGYRMYIEMKGCTKLVTCRAVPTSKTIFTCDIDECLDIFREGYNFAMEPHDYLRCVCIDDVDFMVARLMEIVEDWK